MMPHTRMCFIHLHPNVKIPTHCSHDSQHERLSTPLVPKPYLQSMAIKSASLPTSTAPALIFKALAPFSVAHRTTCMAEGGGEGGANGLRQVMCKGN
jgi:hypothetical protein